MFRVGSIFIPVTDLERSMAWCEEHLGVKKIDEWEDGVGYCLPDGLTQLALVKVESRQETEFTIKGDRKNAYFNFLTENIEAVHEGFRRHGVTVTAIEDFGGMKAFDFNDPDGNPFSIVDEVTGSPFHSEEVRKLQGKS
ncbi:VOC family protein [Rossellomorea marisflavi]|uniref:VOC family protein n=1 Tax=Rossellomorea marisflavi TaxID=189381 RepID=UPI00064E9530|nr:VOC family protein [Rossellomorea marisflavi]KML02906.1 glyoxalase [Rossellomorea marisflavi]